MKPGGLHPRRLLAPSLWWRLRRAIGYGLIAAALSASAGEHSGAVEHPTQPLAPDSGAAGLQQMLRRLGTTARLMQTTAHPDDEDGGMLTLESRGKGASVLLMTLTRGEGGQNKVGSNLFDVLGVLRTLELTAADRYYGVEQRFSRVADFGYSKSPAETFQKWHGHDIPLGDMVRVIRTFRPDVLVARFSGTERDGHGHHQASSILTQEAFRAAADPTRFPEQIREGLYPWQAKKLYIGNVCGFGATTCPDENYTLKLNTGKTDPLLGESYAQYAMQGLRHQRSQGAATWNVEPGDRFTFYKLVDSVVNSTKDKNGHEQDFFDGIDTSLPGLAASLGDDEKKAPWLRPGLVRIQNLITSAGKEVEQKPQAAAEALLTASQEQEGLLKRLQTATGVSPAGASNLRLRLEEKRDQLRKGAELALGLSLRVVAEAPSANQPAIALPGHTLKVTATLTNSGRAEVKADGVELDLPPGWNAQPEGGPAETRHNLPPGASETEKFTVSVPENAQLTRPYWHRDDPETESLNTIDNPPDAGLPFPVPALQAHGTYEFGGARSSVHATVLTEYKDSDGKDVEQAVPVLPPFSVALNPSTQVIASDHQGATEISVEVKSDLPMTADATLRLDVPNGWRTEPAELPVHTAPPGELQHFTFRVFPSNLHEGRTQIKASLEYGGKRYSEGYNVVTGEDLGIFYYYQPAVQRVAVVDVKLPQQLKIGYIMGAGDEIPQVLKELGMDVEMIQPEDLSSKDLSRFGTVVLGIRAYDTQKQVIANNRRLLSFVEAGGTLLVQYNTGASDFNGGHFTPYGSQLGRSRVSLEEAPVEILAPDDPVFHYPNQITQKDFDGWVQERGLYFMTEWDDHFKPLLASHDPGEEQQKGGLLQASYGKGIYLYTGYAFFRQLPAGVPGAVRLYVNLLSAGHGVH
jgi:LmbE family N-acetylglucosaminyl deacetylase